MTQKKSVAIDAALYRKFITFLNDCTSDLDAAERLGVSRFTIAKIKGMKKPTCSPITLIKLKELL